MFSVDFKDAFNFIMIYEVGPFWDPDDPDVINGLINTKGQKMKVGYVNDPDDAGGETKYGIAQNATKKVVRDMNLEDAMVHYYNNYWLFSNCNLMPLKLALIHFDGCVNHGVKQASKFLQRALGVEDDGVVGARTLDMINSLDDRQIVEVIDSIAEQRNDFYRRIVERKPTQQKFLKGWLKRINEVHQYAVIY